jgi:hypothetical protein
MWSKIPAPVESEPQIVIIRNGSDYVAIAFSLSLLDECRASRIVQRENPV